MTVHAHEHTRECERVGHSQDHDDDCAHDHHHGHSHSHGPGASRKRLAIAFAITATILIAEIVGSLLTGSLALTVDAGHMLTDAGGLLLALVAASLALKPANTKRTWGFQRAEVLAAGAQATILLAVGIYALIEGILRLFEPPEVEAKSLLVIGIIGLLGNAVSIWVLIGGKDFSLNMRAAFLEVVNDALGSIAVIVSALFVELAGWKRADAVAAMLISLLILPRAYRIIKEAGSVLLEVTPEGLNLNAVRAHIMALPHVIEVHDLHASRIDSNTPILTAHVVMDAECFTNGHSGRLLGDLQECVAKHFDVAIKHSTFQLEPPDHKQREALLHE